MAEIEIEDIMRAIKERVNGRGWLSAQQDGSLKGLETTAAERLVQLRMNLAITSRAKDRLPPLVSNRHGWRANVELWIKRQIGRLTHWFTWEQVNFNSAVQQALADINEILLAQERRLANLESQSLEMKEKISSLIEQGMEQLKDEQRVIYKQLSLEISETATVADRARRNAQLRMDELVQQIAELRRVQGEIESLRQARGAPSKSI